MKRVTSKEIMPKNIGNDIWQDVWVRVKSCAWSELTDNTDQLTRIYVLQELKDKIKTMK